MSFYRFRLPLSLPAVPPPKVFAGDEARQITAFAKKAIVEENVKNAAKIEKEAKKLLPGILKKINQEAELGRTQINWMKESFFGTGKISKVLALKLRDMLMNEKFNCRLDDHRNGGSVEYSLIIDW